MGRQITPDQDDSNVELGRFLHELRYARDKKEISLGNIKIDIMREMAEIVIGEIKVFSFKESANELGFYLEIKTARNPGLGELFSRRKEKGTGGSYC